MMNVVVGRFREPEQADAVVAINHIYRDRINIYPTPDAVPDERVFAWDGYTNINFFTRQLGHRFIGIIQERMGWRTYFDYLTRNVCTYKATAIKEILQLAGKSGARRVIVDYESSFDNQSLNNLFKYFIPSLELSEFERQKIREYAEAAIKVRDGQIATLLTGIKAYAQGFSKGWQSNPLSEVIIALDEKAYLVWLQNTASLIAYLQIDRPSS